MHLASQTTRPPVGGSGGGRGQAGQSVTKERSVASLVQIVPLAAQALAQRVVPLARNSFKALTTFTPCAVCPKP
jgi:hypothetical protein